MTFVCSLEGFYVQKAPCQGAVPRGGREGGGDGVLAKAELGEHVEDDAEGDLGGWVALEEVEGTDAHVFEFRGECFAGEFFEFSAGELVGNRFGQGLDMMYDVLAGTLESLILEWEIGVSDLTVV